MGEMTKETPVKAIIRAAAVLVLIVAAAPLFAIDDQQKPARLVDDVIRMTRAGVDEETIVRFVEKSDGKIDVSADDLIAMTDAKVSRKVIKAVLDEADQRDGTPRTERRTVVVSPGYYPAYYGPRYYDPFYYYDPFWYGPRFSFSVGFGRYYGGHRFGHRRW